MKILNAPYLTIAIALQLCSSFAALLPALAAPNSLIYSSINEKLTLLLNLTHSAS
jgi:hypothetical protein